MKQSDRAVRPHINKFHPDPARKLPTNLYDVYHCCVYSEYLLMTGRGTVRNMQSFISKNKFEKLVHLVGFIIRKFVTMHGHMNVKNCDNCFSCTSTYLFYRPYYCFIFFMFYSQFAAYKTCENSGLFLFLTKMCIFI
jgi:hypothetical protein